MISRSRLLRSAGVLILATFLTLSPLGAAKISDLGNAEKPTSLRIDTGRPGDAPPDQETLLVGPEARQQLVVTAGFSSGRLQDYTHRVSRARRGCSGG